MTAPALRRFNPWMWLPLLVIGAAAIPNLVLILMARQAHISKVEEQPWLAAGRIDHDKAATQEFARSGRSLAVTSDGLRITGRIVGAPGPASGAVLRCYRPSDAALDRRLPWPDPAAPLSVELPRDGRWMVGLELDGSLVASHAVDLSP